MRGERSAAGAEERQTDRQQRSTIGVRVKLGSTQRDVEAGQQRALGECGCSDGGVGATSLLWLFTLSGLKSCNMNYRV